MDAFILVTHSGEVIIERYFKNNANESWRIDFLQDLRRRNKSSGGVFTDCIINIEKKVYIIISKNDLYFVGITIQEFPTLLLIELLQRISDNLSHYFGDIISEKIAKTNYSTILNLIDEMIDFGLYSMVETNALTMLVPSKSIVSQAFNMISATRLFNDFVHSIGTHTTHTGSYNGTTHHSLGLTDTNDQPGEGMGSGSGFGTGSGILGSGSALWWRRGNVSYLSNEVYVDVVEKLHCVIDQKGQILKSHVTGNIEIRSQLSGIPNCKLIIKNPNILTYPTMVNFHTCVNTTKWKQDQTISFVPPDGSFTVCQYSFSNNQLCPPLCVLANFTFPDVLSNKVANVPFGKFEITLTPRLNFGKSIGSYGSNEDLVLERVKLSVPLPNWVTGITTVESTSGVVKFAKARSILTWTFSRFPLDLNKNISVKCEGTLNLSSYSNDRGEELIHSDLKKLSEQNESQKSTTQSSSPCNELPYNKDNQLCHKEKMSHNYNDIVNHTVPNNTLLSTSNHSPLHLNNSENCNVRPKDFNSVGQLEFWIKNWAISGILIDSLEVSGLPSTCKGVRSATIAGQIEFRL